jgi:hypothetical protein
MAEPFDDLPVPDAGAEARRQSSRSKHADAVRRARYLFWTSLVIFLSTLLVTSVCAWFPPRLDGGHMMGLVYGYFVLYAGALGVGASAILALVASFHYRGALGLLIVELIVLTICLRPIFG